jgi:phospholipid/cholesterol/gamma-HCH transport system ATP-binding protein
MNEEEISEKITSVLRRVGLAGNESKMPSELSGGMQKRVGLARAICMDPEIILYDDPAAGLDPVLSDSIADLILEIKDIQCATSIVVTHDLKLARKISDFVMLLYNGKNVFYGKTDDFFSEQDEFARQFISGDSLGPMEVV